jgi:hypothetical protein
MFLKIRLLSFLLLKCFTVFYVRIIRTGPPSLWKPLRLQYGTHTPKFIADILAAFLTQINLF